MNWSDDEAHAEYRWLDFISKIKYDQYRDFQAGMRFIESLATWLQQFEREERSGAYQFIRKRLVFVGLSEIQHLVEQFYPKVAHEKLTRTIAAANGVAPWVARSRPELRDAIAALRRKTLFLGLSDGARVDMLRHSNVGRISNEQIAPSIQLDVEKWKDLHSDLKKELGDDTAQFEMIYLIDDFTASGNSLLRFDEKAGKWKGKLVRFHESIRAVPEVFAPSWQLCIHHYVASTRAVSYVEESITASAAQFHSSGRADDVALTYGTVLPTSLPVHRDDPVDKAMMDLARKYYDPRIETKHTAVGGVDRIDLGYGGCGLPLVLEHNTPNNSVALLWAESQGGQDPDAPAMRPLFRRRQRHV